MERISCIAARHYPRIFLPWAPSMNLSRGEEVPEILHVAISQDGLFYRYLLQQPLEPPQFSFWPF